MSMPTPSQRIELPHGIRSKLDGFRRRVRIIKLTESMLAATLGLLLSFLLVFTLDRFGDTPAWLRAVILIVGTMGLGVGLPLAWRRWVWQTRRLEEVARLLRFRHARLSDELLGIVELARNEREQARSTTLCRAAMQQADQQTHDRDFQDAVPNPRRRHWAMAVSMPLLLVLGTLIFVPAAGGNALARWLLPWRDTDRYTFAQLEALPPELIVPYAESFSVEARLTANSAWSPPQASARYGEQQPIRSELQDRIYQFSLPPQKEPETLTVSVGDASRKMLVKPTLRPELNEMMARVDLPNYLQRPDEIARDVRSGSLSLVKGSRVKFEGKATRDLADASMDQVALKTDGPMLFTAPQQIFESTSPSFRWLDESGLSAKGPFVISIKALDDEAPSISCRNLQREQVLLVSDVLSFAVQSQDDFGVKQVGLEWEGFEDPIHNPQPARGEKLIAAGGPDRDGLESSASFSAELEGITPQTLKIRLFTVDYLPDRERTYSPEYYLHVLSPEQHAVWLTRQLSRWAHQARDVYDRERSLHAENRQLRQLSDAEIDQPQNRRRIETQAASERANARRLTALTDVGEQLIKQAARNDQFNISTMETWAGILKSLKQIAGNRMPSVADLLKNAAQAPVASAEAKPADPAAQESHEESKGPKVGVNRGNQPGKGKSSPPQPGPPNKVPSITDVESGFNEPPKDKDDQDQPPGQAGAAKFGLPSTTLLGGPQQESDGTCAAAQKLDQAVREQEDLLDAFAKVADELQRILNNLQGSTFVKRLKAASRKQLEVATDLNTTLQDGFGLDAALVADRRRKRLAHVAERELAASDRVYVIREDLAAYYQRVREQKFKEVLDEMLESHVVSGLQDLAESVQGNHPGRSLAAAEFWADNLDRWAEQLVGPG